MRYLSLFLPLTIALVLAAASPSFAQPPTLTGDPTHPVRLPPPRPTTSNLPDHIPDQYRLIREGVIEGHVFAAETSQPIANCLVVIGTSLVKTDSKGHFRVSALPYGDYIVTVRAQGFNTAFQTIFFYGRNSQLAFSLRPAAAGIAGPSADNGIDADTLAKALKEFDKGTTALRNKKLKDGITHLEKALKIYPGLYEVELLIGTTYMDMQAWDKAEQVLRHLLEINPEAAPAYFARGELYRRQEKYGDAETAIARGLKLNEKSARGHFTLALIYAETGNAAKAEAEITTAIALEPYLAEAHLVAGSILLNRGARAEALAEFETYLRLEPEGKFADKARGIVQQLKPAGEVRKQP